MKRYFFFPVVIFFLIFNISCTESFENRKHEKEKAEFNEHFDEYSKELQQALSNENYERVLELSAKFKKYELGDTDIIERYFWKSIDELQKKGVDCTPFINNAMSKSNPSINKDRKWGIAIFTVVIALFIIVKLMFFNGSKNVETAKVPGRIIAKSNYVVSTKEKNLSIPKVPVGISKCIVCSEDIKSDALKCKHCGANIMTSEWQSFYNGYDNLSMDRKKIYWESMEVPEREYLKRIIDFRTNYESQNGSSSGTKDNSKIIGYNCTTKQIVTQIFAYSKQQAKEILLNQMKPGDEIRRIDLMPTGKFSCPKCGSQYSKQHRAIGCAIGIIIFVSLGLGLIMIPFLPYENTCTLCNHKWKN